MVLLDSPLPLCSFWNLFHGLAGGLAFGVVASAVPAPEKFSAPSLRSPMLPALGAAARDPDMDPAAEASFATPCWPDCEDILIEVAPCAGAERSLCRPERDVIFKDSPPLAAEAPLGKPERDVILNDRPPLAAEALPPCKPNCDVILDDAAPRFPLVAELPPDARSGTLCDAVFDWPSWSDSGSSQRIQ